MSDAIARRDILRMRISPYRDLAQAASITENRYSRSDVKFHSAVSVAQIQKEADALSKEHGELDARIQEANWLTELSSYAEVGSFSGGSEHENSPWVIPVSYA